MIDLKKNAQNLAKAVMDISYTSVDGQIMKESLYGSILISQIHLVQDVMKEVEAINLEEAQKRIEAVLQEARK